jgi:hypothetical protein
MGDHLRQAVYLLCAATSVACAVMLLRGYFRSRTNFLLWSSLCFVGLAINNILLFADKVIWRETDLTMLGIEMAMWRSGVALIALGLLLYGLIWDAE